MNKDPGTAAPTSQQIEGLKRKVRFYKACLFCALAGIVLIFFSMTVYRVLDNYAEQAGQRKNIPCYNQVMSVIRPLVYSGFKALVRPEVDLSIDFANNSYTVKNLHRFDEAGVIILEDNRYGLCGELASYVFRRVRPIIPERYKINFVRVAESGFFANPKSTHIVLLVSDTLSVPPKRYFIDPSFHRYGSVEEYDNYLFIETLDHLAFEKDKFTDVTFAINGGTPILIKDGYMIELTIGRVNGKFDKDNFIIALGVQEKYKFTSRYIFGLIKDNGKVQELENKALAMNILGIKKYEQLKKKLWDWFEQT
ncbi:MAG: hypothetical protein M0R35_06700 [Candidatus Omnitrophica bacterium]|jgi:hypothetical protein|nr:hypothetical protein [Candidatus Omnitrophota bacterium]